MTDQKPRRPCPICQKPASVEQSPFCGGRCAQVDLGRWFAEGYRVPTDERAADDTPEPPATG